MKTSPIHFLTLLTEFIYTNHFYHYKGCEFIATPGLKNPVAGVVYNPLRTWREKKTTAPSSVPPFPRSSVLLFLCSSVPLFLCSSVLLFPCSPVPPFPNGQKKATLAEPRWLMDVAAAYSPGNDPSTIGAAGLNFSVRDGKRWCPRAGPPVPCATGACVPGHMSFVHCFSMTVFAEDAGLPRGVQDSGLLVPLGFGIAAFTPAAYRRHRL
jgi:hypothetical protein